MTLTFNDAGLKKMSPDGSLNKDHMVAFMKDLRREMDDPVRVFLLLLMVSLTLIVLV